MGARLFGPIEVAAGGRRLGPRDLGGPKAKQVLELLLMARGHDVTKDRLADQLWGESLPKRAFAALENHVSVLRRHLDGVGRGRDLVVTDPGGYRVAAERIDLDLDRFDERITAAGKAGTRMARKLLSEAVQARARGEVLEDEPYACQPAGWHQSVTLVTTRGPLPEGSSRVSREAAPADSEPRAGQRGRTPMTV